MHSAKKRVRLASALFGIALLGAVAALAQDPRVTAVQQAALAFVDLTDRDDGKSTWKSAGKKFQNTITEANWAEALHDLRSSWGALADRALVSVQFMTTVAGATAEGDYAVVAYKTSFASRADTREVMTLEREPDGTWRVIGYVVR